MSTGERAAAGALALVLASCAVLGSCGVLRPDAGAPDYASVRAGVERAEAERSAEAATVRVRNLGCDALSKGSGVVVGDRELITNAHVVAGADKLEITTWDGRTLDAVVEDATVTADLARVRVDADLPPAASFASTDPLPGDPLAVYGFPGGGPLEVSTGALVSYAAVDGQRSFVMSNRVRPGNSGGPVFGSGGEVVGIVRALLVEKDEGVAIPVSVVTASLDAASASAAVPGCGAFG